MFTVRVGKLWHRLPRELMDSPPLGTLKVRLGRAVSSLISWNLSLFIAGGWSIWPLRVLSNPNYSMNIHHRALTLLTFKAHLEGISQDVVLILHMWCCL